MTLRAARFVLPFLALTLATQGWSQAVVATHPVLKDLEWRSVGPYRGGRSAAVGGVVGDGKTFYMGTTGGGVWKTLDAGDTWKCVTDGFFKGGSVGAIAVAPSDANVVYVGMGESAIRGNVTPGDGVYKSTDAGATWKRVGLEKTQFIGRIRVHPKNPNVLWVAAIGPVFGKSSDRGVFKSVDGGASWKKVLYVSDEAGAIDVSFNEQNPNVMFATTCELWRRPWDLNSGGPGSGLWTSTDGGEKWSRINDRAGLPKGVWGISGVSVSPVDGNRIYLMLEHAQGGLYSSSDGGKTWTLQNSSSGMRQRPWYYTRVYADPVEKDTVYVLNVQYFRSTDGGKTVRPGVAGHADHHDLWIDPTDNKRLAMSSDGGVSISLNTGGAWSAQDYPTGQFYHVSVDNAFPYNILGAQQDNSTVRIPSRTRGAGITKDDWTSTAGGESGYVVARPSDPDMVFGGSYSGTLDWRHHRWEIGRSVMPWPDDPIGRGAIGSVERFQWTFPIVFSPHDDRVLYVGSNRVLRSKDFGASWERISEDLTTQDASKMQPAGGPVTRDNTAVEVHCTVFTISESPKQKGIIWAGTDDGLIHVTKNDGGSWVNVTPQGMPSGATVSMIEASPHYAGRAVAAVNNYRQNDFKPYIFVTDDFGSTWKEMTAGIPVDVWVRAVREDLKIEGVYYAATEAGVYASAGKNWEKLGGLPEAPVHDLALKGTDLVIATHGRGFYVLDNVPVVRAALKSELGTLVLFPAEGNNVRFGPEGSGDVGKNPKGYGLRVDIWSASDVEGATLTLHDPDGVACDRQTGRTLKKGFNTLFLFPTFPGPRSFDGNLMWGGFSGPIKAPPGDYEIKLALADGREMAAPARWNNNPLVPASDSEMLAKFGLSLELSKAFTRCNELVMQCRGYRKAILDSIGEDKSLLGKADTALKLLDSIENELYQTKAGSSQDLLNFPMGLNNRFASILGEAQQGDFPATKQTFDAFDSLKPLLKAEEDRFADFVRVLVPKLNADLKAAGKSELKPVFQELRPARGGVPPTP